MQTSHTKFLLLLLLMAFCHNKNYAQKRNDTLKTLSHLEKINQKNILLQTDNPVAIHNIEEITEVHTGYKTKGGKYTNYNQPEKINTIEFSAEGYTKPKTVSFYGKITYINKREKQLNWNNTSFTTSNNPFIFADSIASDYDNEQFTLQGKIASKIKKSNFKWGIEVNYKVGNKVNQKDPRPEIQSQRIAIKPGILYSKNKWSFGLNLYYEKFKEEINVSVVEHGENYHFFKLLGFGIFFRDSGSSFSRNYNGNNYGVSFQTLYKKNKSTKSVFEIKYINKYERAEDGSLRTKFLAGDYKNTTFSFYNKWIVNSTNFSNHFLLTAKAENIQGIWFNQKQVQADDNTFYWQVYNKSIRNKSLFLEAEIAYSFLKPSYNIKTSLKFNAEKSTFYPDVFFKNYYNITPNITYKKIWFLSKNQFYISTNLGYRFNFKKSISAGNLELINKITYPEYNYQTADIICLGNEFKIGFTKLFKNKLLPYISFKGIITYPKSKNNFYNSKIRYGGSAKLGVIF